MLTMPRRLPVLWATTASMQLVLGANIAMAAYMIKYIVQALVPFGASTGESTSPTTATSSAEAGLFRLNRLVNALMPFGASIDEDAGDYAAVVFAFSVYAGVSLMLPIIGFMFANASSSMIARMEAELRRNLTLHIMSRGTQFFADRSAGELNAAFSTDVPMITVAIEFWWKTAGTPIVAAVVSIFLIGSLSLRACILFLGALPVLFTAGPMERANDRSIAWTASSGVLVGEFMNTIDVHRVTRALGAYDFVYGRFAVHVKQYEGAMRENTLYQFLVFIVQLNATRAFQVVILICVALEVINGIVDLPDFVAIAQMVVGACATCASSNPEPVVPWRLHTHKLTLLHFASQDGAKHGRLPSAGHPRQRRRRSRAIHPGGRPIRRARFWQADRARFGQEAASAFS
jgi:ABC-type multidrug transport system fused ATPase/permease subunit